MEIPCPFDVFAFISIDRPRTGSDHHNAPSFRALKFGRILHAKRASNERGIIMGALATAVRLRHELHNRLTNARTRTDELFSIVREEALYDRPIAERHRILFYLGHVDAFDWNLLAERAFGLRPFQRTFDHLFAFGIDPVGGGLPTDTPSDWPSRDEVRDMYTRCAMNWTMRLNRRWRIQKKGTSN